MWPRKNKHQQHVLIQFNEKQIQIIEGKSNEKSKQ
jgi:hypothetical protein